jgi:hypothetical protein
MTRSPTFFALPALALSLVAAGLLTACGSKPAAEAAAAPELVVADLYAALAAARPSGAPTDAQRLTLAPLLTAELTGLLQRADAARSAARVAAPGEKPPFTDGDLFSSLFEGPTAFSVGKAVSAATLPGGRLGDLQVPVDLVHTIDPATGGGEPTTWTDTVLLREENGRFVVADIAFGGGWDFANKGTMVAALRAGLGEPR